MLHEGEAQLKAIAGIVKSAQIKDVVSKTEQLQQQLRDLQKENQALASKLANQQAGDVFKDVKEVNGIRFIAAKVTVKDMNPVTPIVNQWKQKNYRMF